LRIVGRFPDQRQVGFVVDGLKNLGLDRKDMIISDFAEGPMTEGQRLTGEIMVQSERDSIRVGENSGFTEGFEGFDRRQGILVSVEIPKHFTQRVREVMEQSGAEEIIQD